MLLPKQPTQSVSATLPSDTPINSVQGSTYNYVGQHQKLTETLSSPYINSGIIQMGARVYIPTLGRFLMVDPVEGGTDNNYVYANDPVNEDDLDGEIAPLAAFVLWQLGRFAVQQAIKVAAKEAAKQAVKQVIKKTAVSATRKMAQTVAKKSTQRIATNARSNKSPKVVTEKGKYTIERWSVNARSAGAPARADWTKIKINGKTRTMYKDSFNKKNQIIHRKYKVCRGRPC